MSNSVTLPSWIGSAGLTHENSLEFYYILSIRFVMDILAILDILCIYHIYQEIIKHLCETFKKPTTRFYGSVCVCV